MNSKLDLGTNDGPKIDDMDKSANIATPQGPTFISAKTLELQEEGVIKTGHVLDSLEQNEGSNNSVIHRYKVYLTYGFINVEKYVDFYGKIEIVSKNVNGTSREIELKDGSVHQLHVQTPELMKILPTPEELLEELFGLEKHQFMEEGRLKMREKINFTPEQKERIQKLLESEIISLAGCFNSFDIFYNQGKMGYLWTSQEGINIMFNENFVLIEESDINSSFCAVYSKN